MIDVKELRIGNIIQYDGWHPDLASHNRPMPPYEVIVRAIEYDEEKKCYIIESFHERAFEDSFDPIPLNHKLLLDIGFKWDDEYLYYQPELQNIQYRLVEFPKGTWILSKGFINYNHELTSIKFLHQFQNTYFSLEHEDFIIDIKKIKLTP